MSLQLDESDYELEDDQNPTVTFRPLPPNSHSSTRKTGNNQPKKYSVDPDLKQKWLQIERECIALQQELITTKLDAKIKIMEETLANGSAGEKSLMIVVHVKRNQVKDLSIFASRLQRFIVDKESFHFKKSQQLVFLSLNTHAEIKDILLDMQFAIDQSQRDGKNEQILTLVKKVSDLNEKNLQLFPQAFQLSKRQRKQGIKKKFILVIPTFTNLQEQSFDRALDTEIDMNYNNLYDSKDLFIQYMYRCLTNPKIKCCLPRQATELITDYDFYPLSFREGVRRLMFLIEQHLFLTKKDNLFVDFTPLTNPILESVLELHPHYSKVGLYERTIRTILWTQPQQTDKDIERNKFVSFSIPTAVISSKINFIQQTLKSACSQNDVIMEVREDLIRRYEKELSRVATAEEKHDYEFCLQVLRGITEQKRTKSKVKKNDRMAKLGITKMNYKSDKHILEDQMTEIIRRFTVKIREQGNALANWHAYGLEEYITPQLPYQIVHNISAQFSNKHSLVTKIVRDAYMIDLSDIVVETAKIKWEEGELMYVLRDLEICGIVDRNKKLSQISYTNNFYEKTKYRARS